MSEERLEFLFHQCFTGMPTLAERQEFLEYAADPVYAEIFRRNMEKAWGELREKEAFSPERMDTLLDDMLAAKKPFNDSVPMMHTPHIPWLRRVGWRYAAAAIILIAGAIAYFRVTQQPVSPVADTLVEVSPAEVLPGSDKAILTLSNGQQIRLDATANELLKSKGIVNKNSQVSYAAIPETDAENTLSTPRGGQYQLKLSDGTLVWLNAASSIRYPAAFKGGQRVVSVTGEVYFEVAKNAEKPFVVLTPKGQIKVLGTHFNVNAYADETAETTSLLEGSLRISDKILKSGETFSNGKIIMANVRQAVAWKEGVFDFENMHLQQAMRILSRWYDVDIIYENNIPDFIFGGEMGRDLSLDQVLKALSVMGVKFRIDHRKVIVTT